MNQRSRFLLVLALGIIFISATYLQAQVTLRIGDPAPVIKHSKWIKGTPMTTFEKGKIYVVEFWATWCTPCKISIPHLTRLAHKYEKDLIIIGMDVKESIPFGPELSKRVVDYTNTMGDKMDYNVAMDTKENIMLNNWMLAAGQDVYPTAFIVDKDLKIAWIGHPENLDEPLAQMIEGRYDIKAFAAKFGPTQTKEGKALYIKNKFEELGKTITDADEANDYAKVISESELLLVKEPSLREKIYFYYFRSLLRVNPDKALSIARETETTKIIEPINNLIYRFTEEGLNKKAYDFVIEILAPILEKNPKDFNTMMNLAPAYEHLGNKQKAIDIYQKMIAFAKATKLPDNYIKPWENKVAELKSKK